MWGPGAQEEFPAQEDFQPWVPQTHEDKFWEHAIFPDFLWRKQAHKDKKGGAVCSHNLPLFGQLRKKPWCSSLCAFSWHRHSSPFELPSLFSYCRIVISTEHLLWHMVTLSSAQKMEWAVAFVETNLDIFNNVMQFLDKWSAKE